VGRGGIAWARLIMQETLNQLKILLLLLGRRWGLMVLQVIIDIKGRFKRGKCNR
jgi:hypothetical protein